MVSEKAVVRGTVPNGEEDVKEECTYSFGNKISGDISYACLDYRPLSGNDNIAAWSIMQRSRIDDSFTFSPL